MEQRQDPWPSEQPRQRRRLPWPRGTARERRRTRWSEFRDAYPRIVTATVMGLVFLLTLDLALLFKRLQWGRELGALRGSMTEVERQQADAIVASQENRTALMVAVARAEATGDRALNLSVSAEKGTMVLQQEGAGLREMPVRVGPEATVGAPGNEVRLVPPLGKRTVLRVLAGDYSWEVPAWVWRHRGQPVPGTRRLPGALGPRALVLDGGALIYSLPRAGPLADESYVLPGSVRAAAADLDAIAENLRVGMPVYFH
jgi:hypothetical protein